MKVCRIYGRVSCASQRDSGLGIAAQKSKCLSFVNEKFDGYAVEFYVDEGLSGTLSSYKRPSLNKLLQDLEEGDVLVSYDCSRIARDTMVWLNIEMSVKKSGCVIELASGMNGDTLEMTLIRRIMSQVNEYSVHTIGSNLNE